MGKIKIHEIAKELGLASKAVLERANNIGIAVTSHLSSVTDEQADLIKKECSKQASSDTKKESKVEAKKAEKATEKKSTKKENKPESKKDNNSEKKAKKETPVIIRREVILTEDDDKKSDDKKESARKDVGFVERKKNDYNIVYRNKTVKPLTVDELFGIKKKEAKPQTESKKEPEITVTAKEAPKKELELNKENEPRKEESKKDIADTDNKQEEKAIDNKAITNNAKFQARDGQNRENNHGRDNQNRDYRNQENRPHYNNNRNENYGNRNGFGRDRDNQNRNNNFRNNNNNYNNRNNNFNRDGQNQNNNRNNFGRNNNNNGFNRNNNGGFNRNNNNGFNKSARPLDNKRIDKNIKDIMETEIVEKENQRDYASRAIDKEKNNNRYDESKNKRATKSRRFTNNEDYDEGKLKNLKQVDRLSNMFEDQDGGMLDYYDLSTERGKRGKRKNQKNNEERNKQKIFKLTDITIPENISVKDLASELKKTSGEVIKKLLELGIMATINQELDFDTAFLVAGEFGVNATKKEVVNEEDILFDESEDREEDLVQRPPVVVVMGHVDHGKTSLLDAIRKTNVIEGEAGGITQHIGAYKVSINGRDITFLDTPGHEAFTSMRARGAQITDVAILIVAADDGVMPQTVEAINHAKAAGIPIIVAINKIDVPGANPEKVKQELMKYELVPEEWGGDTIFVEISAKQHTNIDQLLEMVLLVSDMQDLKVNPNKQAKGVVIEARLDKAKGPIASVLVQRGKLDVGDTIVVGTTIGRIRAMKDDKGKSAKSAGPSTPVEIMGLTKVPEAGETFYEVKDEKMAKHLIEKRERKEREAAMNLYNKVTLDNLFEKMENEDLKHLNIIVKADVQGTAEALKQSLEKLSDSEVAVRVIHSNAGSITESDVNLAKASEAIIIGFNVRPNSIAKDVAEKLGVEIKLYSVIYQALEDVEAAMNGMLDPIYEEKVIGNVEVRQTFKISNVGTIAGGYVKEGRIERNAGVRVIREDIVVHEGKLISLKRFKDDVKEVAKGFECGLQIEGYNDLKEGDIIEVYIMEEKPRTRKSKLNEAKK